MPMIKNDLIQHLYETSDLPSAKAAEVVETMLAEMKQSLAGGEDIKITGSGNFVVHDKPSALAAIRRMASRSRRGAS